MQHVLVTGGNRGIGLEFVRQLLARGDRVYAACRHPGRALALTELAGAHPGHLKVLPLEADKERSIAELARETAALTDSLDVLINNAGMLVSGERFGALAAKPMSDTFATNVIGPVLLTQALAPLLENSQQHAKVLNITSELGSIADTETFGTPSYSISKAALNMATRQLAAALRERGVTVICAHPGWVKTDMGGAGATLTPQAAVTGLLKMLDAVKPADTGTFFEYTGKKLRW
jgi:NAD(P)-dependent dehydrogenase (short-subunit alcohol dehydrogenase family)